MAIKKGIYAASMSIFNQDLTLDTEATIQHSEKLINEGLHGSVLFGSTGCAQLISSQEKKKLIDKLNTNKFKDHFIIGTGANALNENIGLMKHCLENGIDKFLLMPPAYYKYDDEGAYLFYAKIIEKIKDCKIILYNFEKLSGYKFSIDCVKKLAKNFPDQIIGVKDSTYNLYEKLKIPNFSVLPGSELKLLKGLEIGCSGVITATANVTAVLSRKVFDDFQNKKSQTMNEKLCKVRRVFDKYNLISALHSYKSDNQSFFKRVLPPLKLLNKKQHKELVLELENLNFIYEDGLAA